MTTVLIADDNQSLLENIGLDLEMRGYSVLMAGGGRSALNLLHSVETLPDIIVSDISMPDLDGYKLLEAVRSDARLCAIPFLFLTAYSSPDGVRLGRELGVDDEIVKPFQADDLVIAMENKLRRVNTFRFLAEKRMDETRHALMWMISHELRTPLTAIYGGSELLSETVAQMPGDDIQEMMGLIRSGVARLNRFMTRITTLMEIDSGELARLHVTLRGIHDIRTMVETALKTIEDEIATEDRSVSIALTAAPEALWVEGVPQHLVMMMEELLRNAMKFTPRGGTIEVGIEPNDDFVVITITDRGCGIAPEDLDRVWERFVQIDRYKHEQQGVGVGLSIVRALSDIHGGEAVLESAVGRGTRAIVRLPLVGMNAVQFDNSDEGWQV